MYQELTTGWTVRVLSSTAPDHLAEQLGEGIRANVPGIVHTDLLAAGLITDPFVDNAEAELTWIGRSDWEYRTTFDWTGDDAARHDLFAEGRHRFLYRTQRSAGGDDGESTPQLPVRHQ